MKIQNSLATLAHSRIFLMLMLIIMAAVVSAITIQRAANPASNVTENSAIISWATDVPATSVVNYGTTRDVSETIEDAALVLNHEVLIANLLPRTSYFFKFKSVDSDGNSREDNRDGALFQFTTLAPSDRIAPRISNIQVLELAEQSTTIGWTTDEPSTSVVYFGETAPTQEETVAGLATDHAVTITTTSGKVYKYMVGSCDAVLNCINSSVEGFLAGTPTGPPSLNVTIPDKNKDSMLDLSGTTRPFVKVTVFVNNEKQRDTTADSLGRFSFADIRIPGEEADIKIEAADQIGKAEKEGHVKIDRTPPKVVIQNISAVVTQPQLVIPGETDKPSTIEFRVLNVFDNIPPEPVKNLRITRTDKNTVELAWVESSETDFKEYLLLRNGERLVKTTGNAFTDDKAPPRVNSYQVLAVDSSCNIAVPSNSVDAPTAGDAVTAVETVELDCEKPAGSLQTAAGPFSIPINLNPGMNVIKLTIKDDAGHETRLEASTTLDSGPPTFVRDNLDAIQTSYIPEVVVKGQVSEQATVFVYVNSETKATTFAVTQPDGSFEIPIILERNITVRTTPQTQLEMGEGFENNIILEAIDQAGLKVRTPAKKVIYSLCGFGTNFDIQLGKPRPSMLIPRLIVQQIQEIGMTVNASYRGRNEIEIQDVTVNRVQMAEEFENRFDNGLVDVTILPSRPAPGEFMGLIQLKFTSLPEDVPTEETATMAQKEEALSNHRLVLVPNVTTGVQQVSGRPALPFAELGAGCINPALGCMKFFIELEVQYQEKIKKLARRDPRTQQVLEDFDLVQGREKKCIPIEIAIDRRPPPNKIPKGFLKATLKVLDTVIELFDQVLKPLTIIGQYSTYACFGMNAVVFSTSAYEMWQCKGTQIWAKVSGFVGGIGGTAAVGAGGGGEFDEEIARAGLCDAVYNPTTESEANKNCNDCADAAEEPLATQYNLMQPICDRVACPSAPTLQTHIKDQTETLIEITEKVHPAVSGGGGAGAVGDAGAVESKSYSVGTDITKWKVGERLFIGEEGANADCAFTSLPEQRGGGVAGALRQQASLVSNTPMQQQLEAGATQAEAAQRIQFGQQKITLDYNGLKKVYDNKKKLDEGGNVDRITKEDCEKFMRPAHPACCGQSYMREWGTACGYSLPVAGTIYESFDELQQSVCESAQATNHQEDKEELDCGGVANAVAGFCEPGTGNPVIDPIPTRIRYGTPPAGSRDNQVYVLVVPMTEENTRRFQAPAAGAQQPRYRIVRGFVSDTFRRAAASERPPELSLAFAVESNTEAVPDMPAPVELTEYFNIETREGEQSAQAQVPPEQQAREAFAAKLCSGIVGCREPGQRELAEQAYDFVKSKIEFTGKTYIVKPAEEGFLRSFQCACLPALTSYIQQWRNIFGVARQCVQSILLTGDGSEGVCQALLSQYICDMLFDVVKCFVQKWGSSGAGGRTEAGAGDFIGALTNTGSRVRQRVDSRYGSTQLWKTMFVEKKLVNSVCAFAFTGTWNFDVTNIFNQQVETIPIESQAFFPKCNRRYVNFDPTSSPPGKTTWVYEFAFGLAAGSDVRYDLKFRCSTGFRCKAENGFRNGECDCNKGGEQTLPIQPESCTPPLPSAGQLNKGDILNTQCFHTIQASEFRFDKAILDYTYRDPRTQQEKTDKVECNIDLVGDDAPAECAFDPFRGMFRCSFGVGESAIKFNSINTDPKRVVDSTPVFGIGEPVTFNIGVTQYLPEERDRINRHKKFLLYEIRDQNGNVVEERTERSILRPRESELATNGDYTKQVNLTNLVTTRRIAGVQAAQPVPPLTRKIIRAEAPVEAQVTAIRTLTTNDARQPEYLFVFNPDGSVNVYEGGATIIRGNQRVLVDSTREEETFQDSGFQRIRRLVPNAVLRANTLTVTYPSTDPAEPARMLAVEFTPPLPAAGTELLARPAAAPTDPCTEPISPVEWSAKFKAVDADNNGRATSQVSVDPSTGARAEIETSFNVICREGTTLLVFVPAVPVVGQCRSPMEANTQPCKCPPTSPVNNCPDPANPAKRYCVELPQQLPAGQAGPPALVFQCVEKPACPPINLMRGEQFSRAEEECFCVSTPMQRGKFCCAGERKNTWQDCVNAIEAQAAAAPAAATTPI